MMENAFLWAQIAGCIAFGLSVWRLQLKNPRHIALGEVPTATMWAIQYYILNAPAGLIINLLCIVRGALVYLVPDWFLKYVILFFLALVTLLVLKSSTQAYDLLPLLGVYLYAIACLFRNDRPIMTRLILLHSIPWLAYNIIILSYFGVLSSSLGMLSVLIGMYRHENWHIGKCYKTFIPSIVRSLFPNFRTYP